MSYLGTKPANQITDSTLIADGTITTSDLANGAVTPAKLSTGAPNWDTSGNLGIGTSSPSYRLHVANSGYPAVGFFRDLDVGSVGAAGQAIEIGARSGSTFVAGAAIIGDLDNPSTTGVLRFQTRSSNTLTERMRIDSSGNLLVGTTSNTYNSKLSARGIGDNVAAQFYRQGTASGSAIVVFSSNAGGTEALKSYIDVSSGGLTVISDERNKENLSPITDAVAKVSQLRSVIGNYVGDENKHPFLIAQDVQKVLPEAVSVQNDEKKTLGISYTDTIPLLVAAIQELKAELDTVKSELATLKGAE